jgi:CheY-specific phosphatase CheX
MNTVWKTALLQATALTFEELCFLFPDPEPDARQYTTPLDAAVQVTFSGPFNGVLIVRLCSGLLRGITANMLGEDEAPSAASQADALGEVANVICGNVLPRVAGVHQVFRLSAPTAIAPDATDDSGAMVVLAEVQLGLDEGRADVLLLAEPSAVTTLEESLA